MAEIVQAGQSIEGLKVEGSSRKPLSYKGPELVNGQKRYKYMANFNTRSTIITKLNASSTKIIEDAIIDIDNTIVCENALIRSLENRYSKKLESNASSTHSTNAWLFPKQTNVFITRGHPEIENGIAKRKQIEAPKDKKMLKHK